MPNWVNRLKLIFLVAFGALSAAAVIYHFYWLRPAQRCEIEERKWWDAQRRVCATPILISDITGRTIQDKAAEAQARKAIGRAPARQAKGSRTAPAPAVPARAPEADRP
jgi:hypothetical protein